MKAFSSISQEPNSSIARKIEVFGVGSSIKLANKFSGACGSNFSKAQLVGLYLRTSKLPRTEKA